MTTVRHINCGFLQVPGGPKALCHCLLLEDARGLALVDTGIGLRDVRDPDGRIGRPLIEMAGFLFGEADTAVRQVERLGFRPADVTDVLTHGDPDHAGGLADFPRARVHVSAEERAAVAAGNPRYRAVQFAHGPDWRAYPGPGTRDWFGLEARPVELGFASEVLLVPLFGHTPGHCGVAVRQGERWALHAGDAYYLRVELAADNHPVSALAAARADDDARRRQSLGRLRRLAQDHAGEVGLFGYHDPGEFPGGPP